ncbi:MAG: hypothetical protein HYR48_01860 [Gemmatimonadetes bacterium]|nr:hypothetical protein [Gemmatimonadota bacterium]
MAREQAVRMRCIGRRFGSVQPLRGADSACAAGYIHAPRGENGAATRKEVGALMLRGEAA